MAATDARRRPRRRGAHGRVEGAIETAEDLGDLAWSAAKCTAKGAFCYIERAVDTGRALYAAAPHLARAVADDPWAVTVQVVKHAACRGDGCSLRDLARNEVKIAVAAASGRGPALPRRRWTTPSGSRPAQGRC